MWDASAGRGGASLAGIPMGSALSSPIPKAAATRSVQPPVHASARGGSPISMRRRGSGGLEQKVVRQVSLPSSRCDAAVSSAAAPGGAQGHAQQASPKGPRHNGVSVLVEAGGGGNMLPLDSGAEFWGGCCRPPPQVGAAWSARTEEAHFHNREAAVTRNGFRGGLGAGQPGPARGFCGLSVEVQPGGGCSACVAPAHPRNSPERSGSGLGLGIDDDMPQVNGSSRQMEHPEVEKAKGRLLPEEQFRYGELRFVEHLGSGEFGQVFRGFLRGEEVAIKQLNWDDNADPQTAIQDFMREIESFRHLRHKRLVNFVGACLEAPNLCLVTEYMPGGSLHHLLHVRRVRLPLLHGMNMCLQLADGVLYLHFRVPCIVHRDLKSLNVVLDLNLNLKLCDFGLTEAMTGEHLMKKNNGGSPRYMAPELFDSKSLITEKIDIWSMGCIFTEIFGGPLPYEGINTLPELQREMLVNRRMPKIPSEIPETLQEIIRSCYTFDHRLRPTSKQVFQQLKDVKRKLRNSGAL